MQTTIMRFWSWVVLIGCLLGTLGLQAQSLPPTGVSLHEVMRLERVPEPPGGLIPYRAGNLWGYADTTGRVVIAPVFTWPLGAPFFTEGFIHLPSESLPRPWQVTGGRVFMNTRGELLRIQEFEAAVVQADGSLLRLPRHQARGLWEMQTVDKQLTEVDRKEFGRLRKVRVPQAVDDPIRPTTAYSTLYALGATRAARTNEEVPLRLAGAKGSKQAVKSVYYALTDSAGQPLTAYKFLTIHSFSNGLALASQKVKNPGGQTYGYLTPAGRWQVQPTFEAATDFRGGVAVVKMGGKYGVITPDGHFRLPLQGNKLEGPDEAGFVRMLVPSAGGAPLGEVRYLPPPGQPVFGQAVVAEGGPFLNGHAWAATASRIGLLNRAGQWLTPLTYEALTAPRRLRSQSHDAADERTAETHLFDEGRHLATNNPPTIYADEDFQPLTDLPSGARVGQPLPDTAYLVGQRQHHYGIVARATGRETVPVRYDSVLYNPYQGIVCVQRADTAYVVACATGRVLAQGYYAGIDFLTARGRLHYLTRKQPAAWALLDTLGHLRTPWISGTGFPTPEGWLLSQEPQGWSLRDSTGRVGYASPSRIAQPCWSRIWAEVQQWDRHASPEAATAWELSFLGPLDYTTARGRFVVEKNNLTVFLDKNAHEISELTGSPLLLPSGWSYTHTGPGLFTDEGRALPTSPPGVTWYIATLFDYPRAWRVHGVVPTSRGYLTRGRRQLWID